MENIQFEGDVEEQDCEKTPSIPVPTITKYFANKKLLKLRFLSR